MHVCKFSTFEYPKQSSHKQSFAKFMWIFWKRVNFWIISTHFWLPLLEKKKTQSVSPGDINTQPDSNIVFISSKDSKDFYHSPHVTSGEIRKHSGVVLIIALSPIATTRWPGCLWFFPVTTAWEAKWWMAAWVRSMQAGKCKFIIEWIVKGLVIRKGTRIMIILIRRQPHRSEHCAHGQ